MLEVMERPVFQEGDDGYWWVLCMDRYFKTMGTCEEDKMTEAPKAMRGLGSVWCSWWIHHHPTADRESFSVAFIWYFKPEFRDTLPYDKDGKRCQELDEELSPNQELEKNGAAKEENQKQIQESKPKGPRTEFLVMTNKKPRKKVTFAPSTESQKATLNVLLAEKVTEDQPQDSITIVERQVVHGSITRRPLLFRPTNSMSPVNQPPPPEPPDVRPLVAATMHSEVADEIVIEEGKMIKRIEFSLDSWVVMDLNLDGLKRLGRLKVVGSISFLWSQELLSPPPEPPNMDVYFVGDEYEMAIIRGQVSFSRVRQVRGKTTCFERTKEVLGQRQHPTHEQQHNITTSSLSTSKLPYGLPNINLEDKVGLQGGSIVRPLITLLWNC